MAASFARPTYEVTVAMGYAKEAAIGVKGGASQSTIIAAVDLEPEDLPVGFIGPGSVDDPLRLNANGSAVLRLAVTGGDALNRSYSLPITLYQMPDRLPIAHATVALTLTEPTFDVSLTLVSTDPNTLAQRWKLKNLGDGLDTMHVVPQGLLASMVSLQPEMDHVLLSQGQEMEFDLVPVLYPGMTTISGNLLVRAQTRTRLVPVSFTPPAGKGVFLGFGASWLWGSDNGTHCTNESPLTKSLGPGPRKAPKMMNPDFWSKKAMADLYAKGTGEGLAAGKAMKTVAKASWLNGPFLALDQVFKGITRRIAQDPPDPVYNVLVRPKFRVPPIVAADPVTELTQAGADALNALVANGYLTADLGDAATATIDKLGGAKAAGNVDWIDKQEALLRSYSQMLLGRTRAHAALLADFEAEAPRTVTEGVTVESVIAAQADLAANGFTADELASFSAEGLDAAAIAEAKASILAANPQLAGALTFAKRAARLYSEEVVSADLARVFELSAMTRSSTRVLQASVLMRFELPEGRCPIGPHTTIIWLNGTEVGRLTGMVPEGLYRFPVPLALVNFFGALPSGNDIGIDTENLNTGSFVEALEASLAIESPVHGELVIAADQAEADALVGGLATANHARPDLVLSTQQVPYLARATLTGSTSVTWSLEISNLGAAPSTATKLGVYPSDPRLGDPGTLLQAEVDVPAIDPGQKVAVPITFAPGLLLFDSQPGFYLQVKQPNDYRPDNNVVRIANERFCGASP